LVRVVSGLPVIRSECEETLLEPVALVPGRSLIPDASRVWLTASKGGDGSTHISALCSASETMGLKYSRRFQSCLYDPTEEELYEREPLLAFSFYLSGRVNALCGIAEEILECLDAGFKSDFVDGA
jgi:hypothetical protein